MLECSNNSCSMARACWMKYKFYRIDGLKAAKKDRNLTLGQVVHTGFEDIYSHLPLNEVLHKIVSSYDTAIKLATPQDKEDLIVDKGTALGMVEFYPEDMHQFQDNKPEKSFNISLCRGVRLVGRIDGDVKFANARWVRELKTTGVAVKQFKMRCDNSFQASGYKYALEKLTGVNYEGVMFDVIRKPRLYKRVDENATTYARRIYEDYASTKVNAKKKDSYFARHYSYRNQFQMECFERDTIKLAKEIRTRTRKDDWYRNPDACMMFNRLCEYHPICWVHHVPQDVINQNYIRHGKVPEVVINTEDLE
jgi:hypothetical protein